ncbi:hypothetical protein EYZ11_007333 [Aspergillus tanneri]|uniref:Uncharacterized protein n=1 Tax=Aspergillus tanneri TaxID=1220188 RepID=A0A4S3JDL2_9EURO|nr:hypothetical protein EYZ11_007333 [Aspergillus tanneri]
MAHQSSTSENHWKWLPVSSSSQGLPGGELEETECRESLKVG